MLFIGVIYEPRSPLYGVKSVRFRDLSSLLFPVLSRALRYSFDCAVRAYRKDQRDYRMIIRILLSVTAFALGITIAAAQDPIKERKDLMRGLGDQAKIGGAMAKRDEPFDLAKAQKIFATFADTASKAPALFPPNSNDEPTAEDPYTASPKVWQDMNDFKSRFEKFGADAKQAGANVKDLDTFKAAFGSIGKDDCGGCHQDYRLKKS
jgi:cytochrome c556